MPDFWASRASWTTRREAGPGIPTPRNAALSMLVRLVTASNLAAGVGLEPCASSLAFVAARIISTPPRACKFKSWRPGKAAALAMAPWTVLGMSWNFKSRNMPGPRWFNFLTADGPSAVNKCIFILNMPTNEESDWASSNAGSREGKSSARINFWRARSIRDVLAPQAARLAS
jgi:hypothetical protein